MPIAKHTFEQINMQHENKNKTDRPPGALGGSANKKRYSTFYAEAIHASLEEGRQGKAALALHSGLFPDTSAHNILDFYSTSQPVLLLLETSCSLKGILDLPASKDGISPQRMGNNNPTLAFPDRGGKGMQWYNFSSGLLAPLVNHYCRDKVLGETLNKMIIK